MQADFKDIIPVVSPEPSALTGSTMNDESHSDRPAHETLIDFINQKGDISDLLSPGELDQIGRDAIQEWGMDKGSNESWREKCEYGLEIASQNFENEEAPQEAWRRSRIHVPIMIQAQQQWSARAYPEIVKADKIFGIKVFDPPSKGPSPGEIQADSPPPANQMDAQASQNAMQQAQSQENIHDLQSIAKRARGERVAHFMNWTVMYQNNGWEDGMDLLLNQLPVTGSGFKKVYMTPDGVKSDFISPLHLTVHKNTKNMESCPRITHDFELYPNDIKSKIRSSIYRDVNISWEIGQDKDTPRVVIEQYRNEDLDHDGLAEPYIVTVDVESEQVLRIEPAFGLDDVHLNDKQEVIRVNRWQPFASFKFLPDLRGNFYGTGFAQLLQPLTDTIDTCINQLIDAGFAQIAGGGLISGGVRLDQGGSIEMGYGEYLFVSGVPGQTLRDSIWERTLPNPSDTTLQMLQMLIDQAKDIAGIKDVTTGESNPNAPVGTTLALQTQALTVFSSIYKRVYNGLRTEAQMVYNCLRRFGTEETRRLYMEETDGDFDADFDGDGTDIQPVADPNVVTKQQKIARMQTLEQIAESPSGQAAGMLLPKTATTRIMDMLRVLDIERPERYLQEIPPDQQAQMAAQLKLQLDAAEVKLKTAQSQKANADATKSNAQAGREVVMGVHDAHNLNEDQGALLQQAMQGPQN